MADPIPSLNKYLNVNRTLPNMGGTFNVANSTPSGVTTPVQSPDAGIMAALANIGRTRSPIGGNPQSGQIETPPAPVPPVTTPTTPVAPDEYENIISQYTGNKNTSPNTMGGTSSTGTSPTSTGNAPLDFMSLRAEQLRDRANGTGLYALPQGVSLTPDQVFGLRSMADNHYNDLIQSATDYQKELNNKSKTPLYGIDSDLSGLSTNAVNTLYKMSDDFNNHPIVKDFNVIQRASSAANNILKDINSRPDKNPTAGDDMSLMYLFAKAQDPNSVVRESEYANVGDYFSSLPQAVQFKLSQLYKPAPDGRLTDEARKNIAHGIKTLYETNKQQYDNLRTNAVDHMKRVAGKDVSDAFLNKYEDAYSTPSTSGAGSNGYANEGAF